MPTPDAESGYDTSQPFLERVKAAVEGTREEKSPFITYREDGAYKVPGAEWWSKDSVDGMGTKGLLHWKHRTFAEGAQDAFAMAVNDLYRDRCIPYKGTNVCLVESDDHEAIAEIIEGLAAQAKQLGIQMGDGEIAILNTINGFELDMTATGCELSELPNRYQAGDILIGLPSSGIHSNGLSRLRRLYGDDYPLEVLTPTRVYSEVAKVHANEDVHGLTHVTGDAFRKLTLNGADVEFYIDHFPFQESGDIFNQIYGCWASTERKQMADHGMYLEYNNGIGFILGVHPDAATDVMEELPDARVIGRVVQSHTPGVTVNSRYSGQLIRL